MGLDLAQRRIDLREFLRARGHGALQADVGRAERGGRPGHGLGQPRRPRGAQEKRRTKAQPGERRGRKHRPGCGHGRKTARGCRRQFPDAARKGHGRRDRSARKHLRFAEHDHAVAVLALGADGHLHVAVARESRLPEKGVDVDDDGSQPPALQRRARRGRGHDRHAGDETAPALQQGYGPGHDGPALVQGCGQGVALRIGQVTGQCEAQDAGIAGQRVDVADHGVPRQLQGADVRRALHEGGGEGIETRGRDVRVARGAGGDGAQKGQACVQGRLQGQADVVETGRDRGVAGRVVAHGLAAPQQPDARRDEQGRRGECEQQQSGLVRAALDHENASFRQSARTAGENGCAAGWR